MKSDQILRDVALLAVRVTVGSSMAAHGAQKLFGSFGGPGLQGASKFMESVGFHPGEKYARAASVTEIAAGVLIAAGAFGAVGPALLASTMIVAAETVHRKNGYFQTNNGFELNAMYLMLALALANTGNGSMSVDGLLRLDAKLKPTFGWLVMAGGIAGAMAILAQRTTPPASPTTIRVETGTTEPAQTSP